MTMIREIRCPIHGFISLNDLEWELINHPAFQRLRRIRQLAWTDYVYPGAMHTRFEHSIGVMHVATRLFDALCKKHGEHLKNRYDLNEAALERQHQVVRIAALLHDVGHAPFSHASEELFPEKAQGKHYEHEEYSAAIMNICMKDIFEGHIRSRNLGIKVDDITAVFSPGPQREDTLVLKDIVSGQMDADRMDYLLRDSYHAGVNYGRYDLDRIVNTIALCEDPETGADTIGVDEDGLHAIEALLIARYMMFTQVYFHKTRSIYDLHLVHSLRDILSSVGGNYPKPDESGIKEFLKLDDWWALGELSSGKGGAHGEIIRTRQHHRRVFETSEIPTEAELEKFNMLNGALASMDVVKLDARKSWYKVGGEEIPIRVDEGNRKFSAPLSERSPIVKGLKSTARQRLYVPVNLKQNANKEISRLVKAKHND